MKKRRIRFLAVCLGLIVVLSACASAPSGDSTAPEESKATSALELSEVNAESTSDEAPSHASKSESAAPSEESEHSESSEESEYSEDTVSETPAEKAGPVWTEERETTLEKVLSFDIGIDGLFQYRMLYYDDPSIADIEVPGEILIGGDGKFYHMVANSPMNHVVSLHDGTALEVESDDYDIGRVWVYENRLYKKAGEYLYEYDIANGLDGAKLIDIRERDGKTIYQTAGGKLYLYAKGQFYTMQGEAVRETVQHYTFSDQKLANGALVAPSDTARWVVDSEKAAVIAATDETILVREKDLVSPRKAIVHVYTWYDRNGNAESRLGYKRVYHEEKLPCEVDFDLRGAFGTVKEYMAKDVYIGKTVFENVLWEKLIFDSCGTPYLVIYYLDHGEIYRVNPGYTSADLTKKEVSAEKTALHLRVPGAGAPRNGWMIQCETA